jgi:tetratricopeptide (TPR) repeat protein
LRAPPADPAARQRNRADCVQSGDPERSIAGCSGMIEDSGESARNRAVAYYNRGNAHYDKNQLDGAIADYTESIRLDPERAGVYHNRGDAYLDRNQFDRAIADYGEAVRLDGSDFRAHNNRGRAYRLKDDLDRAIEDYSAAVRISPEYALGYNNRGYAYELKGEFDRALADYDEAIRLDPDSASAYDNRGRIRHAKGELDRAIADHGEALKLAPRYAIAHFDRGVAYYAAGRLPEALADFNQASELDPRDAYMALWLDIVGRRSQLPSRLAQSTAVIDMTVWPAPVLRLFLGQLTMPALLAAAADSDMMKQRRQVCDANFYGAELALLQGGKEEAAPLLKTAARDCPRHLAEWRGAGAELKALGLPAD